MILEQQNQGAALYVRVGDGSLALDPSEAEVAWVANQIFLRSGLAELSLKQLQKALEGQQLTFGFSVGFDAIQLDSACNAARWTSTRPN